MPQKYDATNLLKNKILYYKVIARNLAQIKLLFPQNPRLVGWVCCYGVHRVPRVHMNRLSHNDSSFTRAVIGTARIGTRAIICYTFATFLCISWFANQFLGALFFRCKGAVLCTDAHMFFYRHRGST